MSNIELYGSPGSCSKVAMILLEQAGADYTLHTVHLGSGAHKTKEYKSLNPKGKVPALVVDGITLTENPVIISYIVSQFPKANLMPAVKTELEKLQQWSDLCFCSSNLHPVVTRIAKPEFFADQACLDSVKQKGIEAMDAGFSLIEDRLGENDWWYGNTWSAMDVYIYWVYTRVQRCDFDFSRYPQYVNLAQRMEEIPAVQRAIVKEESMLG
ncbi:glutathione S-transferase family protein [Aestuariicella hydrocarbonica]|uniref:Glutathione S-transferase family protein n=1 Tax=Pseudomaricurvus hydrocarbonicus TaxID=1470433 RepID=A0A9E5JWH9_9GAMM|nr:glutathione S-transferase family protein [Aestuariicella hydrocarbonica]NHO66781.1 glutathione S-transferase family protein [Aestuariicella hydrocarbonica]